MFLFSYFYLLGGFWLYCVVNIVENIAEKI